MLGCLSEFRGCLALAQELKSCSLESGWLQTNLLCPTESVGADPKEMFSSRAFAPLWARGTRIAAAHSAGPRLVDLCIIPSLLSLLRSGEQLFYDPSYSEHHRGGARHQRQGHADHHLQVGISKSGSVQTALTW